MSMGALAPPEIPEIVVLEKHDLPIMSTLNNMVGIIGQYNALSSRHISSSRCKFRYQINSIRYNKSAPLFCPFIACQRRTSGVGHQYLLELILRIDLRSLSSFGMTIISTASDR